MTTPDKAQHRRNAKADGDESREPTASQLIKLAEGCDFWHAADDAYVSVPVADHVEHWPIRSRTFRRWLRHRFYMLTEGAPSDQAFSAAVETLAARATFQGQQHDAHLRVAGSGNDIYLDLCDDAWRVIKITRAGWSVVADSPVRFVRHPGMQALPIPVRGGRVDELRKLINVRDEQWPLVAAWLLQALRPVGPYPILDLDGEQGSGKSSASRMLRGLIDPNACPLRAEPREQRDLCIAASHSWVTAFDNLSRVQPWLSDALCRLSTGGGFATRELYSDSAEVLFDATRPALINGIEQLATRPDLLDRALVVTLPTIDEGQRRTEAELIADYDRIRPRVLGALLDAASSALRNVGNVRLSRLPRLADFAQWVSAGEDALGLATGEFMRAYTEARSAGNNLAIEASPIGPAVMAFMRGRDGWSGTSSELLRALNDADGTDGADGRARRSRAWPQTPRGLSGALRRLAPNLRASGLEYSPPAKTDSARVLSLAWNEEGPAEPPEPPEPPVDDATLCEEITCLFGDAGRSVGGTGEDKPDPQSYRPHTDDDNIFDGQRVTEDVGGSGGLGGCADGFNVEAADTVMVDGTDYGNPFD